jgi:hypothetical protein
MTIIQSITLAIALLGATLGLINTWFALDKSRVKLRLVPKSAYPFGSDAPNVDFCIEVTNLSAFAIYLDEGGVLYSGTSKRGVIINPIFHNEINGVWPKKLESRESTSIYMRVSPSDSGHKAESVYMKTQCGIKKIVKSKIMQQLIEKS